MKFGRNYRLTLESNVEGETIIIEPPFTVQFDIKRSTMSSANTMQISIFNLSRKTTSAIFQDRFNPKDYKRIILQAGYSELSTVFIGNIFQANTVRAGAETVTFIDARDGGFDTSGTITSTALSGGKVEDVLKALANNFPNIKEGKITGVEGKFRKPVILNGNNFQLMKKYSNDKVFVDLEKINVLNDNDVLEGDLPLITSETGLLGTPRRDDAYLTIDTLFEPRIVMGQLVEIKSDIAPQYDGQYKVIGVTHKAVISEAISGEAKSTFNLLVGSQLFGGFNKV
tara:strand:- start:101 stop:952 length:852 start_codon:yes stop_codon:yes gene_type:complete